ncbi:hypothetical protein GP486_003827 [Trichoglossum hirsutum]|uniref:Uncharacterized protein n=1 Tax=Trichoglossum hirsutum TaxID=265104 RepID=A0A9P8LC53_9PEZI|nr:hypothetical protein GP486_003827 [Trichoglossum hirsutum]
MPTNAECSEWNAMATMYWSGHKELFGHLKEKWPDKGDRMMFYGWLKEVAGKDLGGAFVSREAIMDKISVTAYNNSAQVRELLYLLSRSVIPCLPAGKDHKGNVYRIVPNGYGLCPEKKIYRGDCLDDNILGTTLPRNSNDSHGPDDTEVFLFHQIGDLEVWFGGNERFEDDDSVDPEKYEAGNGGFWLPTSYHAVIRIDERGASKGLYVIFNFYPEFESDDGQRTIKIDINNSRGGWGCIMIGVGGRNVSIAKIADNVEKLKFTHQFDLTEPFYDSVDLGSVITTEEGTLSLAPAVDIDDAADAGDSSDIDGTDDEGRCIRCRSCRRCSRCKRCKERRNRRYRCRCFAAPV